MGSKPVRLASVVLALVALSQSAQAQDIFGDDKRSFVLLPAEVISSGTVHEVGFSDSGTYVTYKRIDNYGYEESIFDKNLPRKASWYRYNRLTKTSSIVMVPAETEEVIFLGDEKTAFFIGKDNSGVQGFVDISSGAISRTNFDFRQVLYMGEEKIAPYFILKTGEHSVVMVLPDGRSLSFEIPLKVHIYRPIISDSTSIVFAASLPGDPTQHGHLVYNRNEGTSKFEKLTTEQWTSEMMKSGIVPLFQSEHVGELSYAKLVGLPKNLKTEMPLRAKLGRANGNPQFSPKNDCVTIEESGALLIREIKPIDRDKALKALLLAAKMNAMSNARQAALGLLVCAHDMKDVLPGVEGWEGKVSPYFKDADFLKDFNYTFRGGGLDSLDNPGATELGFVSAAGGRAVAYADGHVKWIPNP